MVFQLTQTSCSEVASSYKKSKGLVLFLLPSAVDLAEPLLTEDLSPLEDVNR